MSGLHHMLDEQLVKVRKNPKDLGLLYFCLQNFNGCIVINTIICSVYRIPEKVENHSP